ncbi:unnamed protein product [Schistocephalus solidus]|uniref:DUF3626 domain-containing protein n=1 Tax=Schistocephalus solidus TaxID=70667 RepID=A0A183TJ00_SCHSO|nr:unnamed protein product [Schistocephalus solidus]
MDYNHDSLPPENVDTAELQDFRTLSPSPQYDLAKMRRRILRTDPLAMGMTEALQNMKGGSFSDYLYGKEGMEAMRFTTLAMKSIFAQYPKVAQMDGTYGTNCHRFFADVFLDNRLCPFTQAYKYREAMKRIDPILQKLKSC